MIPRTTAVCAALTEAASATLRKVVPVFGDLMIAGPIGKVRMFLMWHVAELATR